MVLLKTRSPRLKSSTEISINRTEQTGKNNHLHLCWKRKQNSLRTVGTGDQTPNLASLKSSRKTSVVKTGSKNPNSPFPQYHEITTYFEGFEFLKILLWVCNIICI